MRKLASIQKIEHLESIPGADNIEVAKILGWYCVVKKNEFKLGDLCVFFEIDSVLPLAEWSKFLQKDEKPIRIKTMKLKGQISQGLALPLKHFEEEFPIDNFLNLNCFEGEVGKDLTDYFEIKKYEPQIPAQLGGMMKGYFPSFIPKTDEPRIESNPELFDIFTKSWCTYGSIKLDGASMTCYLKDGKFGVCTRNTELKEEGGSTYWEVAKERNIKKIMRLCDMDGYALQGELCGPGIQKNPLGLNKCDFFIFNIYSIEDKKYLYIATDDEGYINTSDGGCRISRILGNHGLKFVPMFQYSIPHIIRSIGNIDTLFYVSKNQKYYNGGLAEGVVWNAYDESGRKVVSFKTINTDYLLS
jgi:RNA ligase (TIGR02306 family)